MHPLRVMLVDDSPAFLAAAHTLLRAEPHVEVVAQCRSGADAVSLAREHRPALIVMDVMMPGMNGLDATRLLKAISPGLRIILVSLHDHAELHASARQAGADHLLNKAQLVETLLPLLRPMAPPRSADNLCAILPIPALSGEVGRPVTD